MKIAGFNSFLFHYEIWGYIIHYCREKNYELTIYTPFDENNNEGYITLYNSIFSDFLVTYKHCSEFDNEYSNYDCIILFTDDDYEFPRFQELLNHKTICIDHHHETYNAKLTRHIAIRPFIFPYNRDWALPCYPIYNFHNPTNRRSKDNIHIVIIGDANTKYDTHIINRIQSINNKKIHLHNIGRIVAHEKFEHLDYNRFDVTLYKDCDATIMMSMLQQSNYILIGTTHSRKNYDEHIMNGCIPVAISTLIPMIIPSQMNKYYGFQNVIEYDRNTDAPIILKDINMENYEKERHTLIQSNHALFDQYLASITQ